MPIVKCLICSKDFYAKPFWIKRGYGKYCSAECQHKGRRNGLIKKCFICGKETYKTRKQLRKSSSKKYFCSKSCQTIWRNREFVGSKHANWIHGKTTYRGVLLRNNIPKICFICGNNDYRVLAVHHVDHNKFNNKLENLIWLCHNCHFLVHHDKVEEKKLMEALV